MQDKRTALRKFIGRMNNEDNPLKVSAARKVSVPQLATLTACLVLEDRIAASWYSNGLGWLASVANAPGCDVIMSAGCIPAIVECLRRWPADKEVLSDVCWALHELAKHGSASVRDAIKCVPGIVETLQAADASEQFDDDYAADTLELLGFSAAVVSVFPNGIPFLVVCALILGSESPACHGLLPFSPTCPIVFLLLIV